MRWKGDHVTRAANRAQSAEAILALAVWKNQRKRREGERLEVRLPGDVLRSLAGQSSESAAILRDRAETMFQAAQDQPKLAKLADYYAAEAERAEDWAARAHETCR